MTSTVRSANSSPRRGRPPGRGGPLRPGPPLYGDGTGPDEKPPPRNPLWAKILIVVGALVMVASGGIVVITAIATNVVNNAITQQHLLPPQSLNPGLSGAQNILLLGLDQRPTSPNDLIRTDSIMIVHINAAHNSVQMVSIPRDSLVSIPAYPPGNYAGGQDKINAAFAFGDRKDGKGDPSEAGRQRGVDLLIKTINNLVPGGITFTGVAIINYEGFDKLVNALGGGINMCVDERAVSLHYDYTGKYVTDTVKVKRYVYEKGCRFMKTWQVLDYVRLRDGLPNTDYDRQRHQQQFLFAVFKQLLSKGTLTDPSKLSALQAAAGGFLSLDLDGIQLADWLFAMKSIRTSDIVLVKTNNGTFNSIKINNISYEKLSDKSLQLFLAVKNDTVVDFLAKNPTWMSKPS